MFWLFKIGELSVRCLKSTGLTNSDVKNPGGERCFVAWSPEDQGLFYWVWRARDGWCLEIGWSVKYSVCVRCPVAVVQGQELWGPAVSDVLSWGGRWPEMSGGSCPLSGVLGMFLRCPQSGWPLARDFWCLFSNGRWCPVAVVCCLEIWEPMVAYVLSPVGHWPVMSVGSCPMSGVLRANGGWCPKSGWPVMSSGCFRLSGVMRANGDLCPKSGWPLVSDVHWLLSVVWRYGGQWWLMS